MSSINTLVLRDEAGVSTAFPGVSQSFNTHCDGHPKPFKEVLAHFDGVDWVEDPVFVPDQSVPVIRVDNDCDATYSLLNIGYNDFRLKQLCCVVEGGLLTEDGQALATEDGEIILEEN